MTAPDTPPAIRRSVRTGVVITSLIGAAAAIYSYNDALFVVREAGTTGRLAYLVPLFADGLIALCSTALYAAAQAKVSRPWWATGGLVFGIVVTVVMNVSAGVARSTADALVDALAPIVFLIALEVLVWFFRTARLPHEPDSDPQCPHGVPTSRDEAVRLDFEHSRDCLGVKPTFIELGARWDIDRRKVPDLIGSVNGSGPHE